jgi:DNA invertase Pin-like site-specific DNA recombinase
VKAKRAAIYVRVSSGEQNTGAQERALRDYAQRRGWKLQQIYRDQGHSGASSNRPALNELMKACRRGSIDVLVVWKFDRFARSLKQLMSGLEMCRALAIDFVSVKESIDTSLPSGELVFQMIGAVAQFERSLIAERVRAGLANSRANGKKLGRPPLRKLTRMETLELRRLRTHSHAPYRELARKFGVSIWTAHKICTRPAHRL